MNKKLNPDTPALIKGLGENNPDMAIIYLSKPSYGVRPHLVKKALSIILDVITKDTFTDNDYLQSANEVLTGCLQHHNFERLSENLQTQLTKLTELVREKKVH